MATRRPIAQVSGRPTEISDADKIPVAIQNAMHWYWPVTTQTANITLKPGNNIIGIRNTGMSTTLNLTGPPGEVAIYRWNLEQGSNMLQTVNVNRVNS